VKLLHLDANVAEELAAGTYEGRGCTKEIIGRREQPQGVHTIGGSGDRRSTGLCHLTP